MSWNSDLARLAKMHSQDMVQRRFFDHINPDYEGPTKRAERLGIKTTVAKGATVWIGIAENIALFPVATEESVANDALIIWAKSSDHRKNLLGAYSEVGVGVAIATDGSYYYITQNFR